MHAKETFCFKHKIYFSSKLKLKWVSLYGYMQEFFLNKKRERSALTNVLLKVAHIFLLAFHWNLANGMWVLTALMCAPSKWDIFLSTSPCGWCSKDALIVKTIIIQCGITICLFFLIRYIFFLNQWFSLLLNLDLSR